ncbi:MAG: hypothetical protein NXH75_14795, partial [Halobacteriovoraceae bacterium]|nr:hypothetical protein [Halobacteriovoraceae bacterium]
GSSLGPEMLVSALKSSKREFTFINNVDPDALHDQLEKIEPKETLFYFVSKSGGTAETMASLAIITNWLKEKGITEKEFKNYFIFATDPVKSELLKLGREWGVTCLEVPSNVGGRFSVLTPVGLLPALFAGINTSELLEGAQEIKKTLLDTDLKENKLLKSALYLHSLKDKGFNQTVLMPYSSKLRDLSFWFVQLWAESLGKKMDKDGNVVNTGLTPLPSYGATDQHSQVQLFMEGPYDKVTLFLKIENFDNDFPLNNDIPIGPLEKLKPYSLAQLMEAELNGTLKAMEEAERPYLLLKLEKCDANHLGQILLYLESLTVLMGIMLNINPFDQPGVEAGKRYAFQWLAKI